MPAMDVTSYRGDPIQESMMQLCPFWTCNIVRFGLATLYIYILQQTFNGILSQIVSQICHKFLQVSAHNVKILPVFY